MSSRLVHINLLGSRFSIQTDEEPEYIQQLIESLDSRFTQLERSTGLKDPLKLAILTGLFLEDEIRKQQPSLPRDLQEAELLTLQILESLDKTLRE